MASNNDYSILAKVVLDLNNIQSQLNNAAKKVTFKVDGKGIRSVTAELDTMSTATQQASKHAEDLGLTYQQARLIMDKCVDTISSMVEQVYTLNSAMKELAKQFIGKECMIYTIASNDSNIQGVIREIGDGGMLIEKTTGEKEIINLDFITRIREYPRKKNGKKKGIVLD